MEIREIGIDFEVNMKKSYVNFSTFDFLGIFQIEKDKSNKLLSKNLTEPYTEKEVLDGLGKIFKQPLLLLTDESLVHNTVLPTLVNHNDLLIIDNSVNTKIKIATDSLQQNGINSIYISHNQIDELDELISLNKNKYNKIFYIAQSIYSLSGDCIPVIPVLKLLEKHEQFYLYVDDSDGLSWTGESGMGFTCHNFRGLKKTVMVASLTKGFGAEAGAVVVSGVKLILSVIPHQSTVKQIVLHQNIANSIKIHLSDELETLQLQLQEKIRYFNNLSELHSLPVKSDHYLPAKFILIGSSEVCHEICATLLDQGIYVGSGYYPHVPKDKSGITVNIRVNHSKRELKELVTSLSEAYKCTLKKTFQRISE